MQKLRVLPVAFAAALLLPAIPALAAPAYTSQGSTTYFNPALGSVLTPVAQPSGPASGTTGTSTPTQPSPPSTAASGAVLSVGSTTYFGLGGAPAPSAGGSASSSAGSAGASTGGGASQSGTSPQSGSGSTTTGASTAPSQPQGGTAPANQGSLATQFLALINQARAQAGLGALSDSPILDQLALAKAQDMVTYGYVDHYSPRLGWPINQETAAGFEAQSMGAENIAEAGTIQRAMIDLMSDPGHKANILNTGFTQTGIAVLPVYGGVLVEELFAGPSI